MILYESTQASQVTGRNFGCGLCLDGDLHLIDDKVYLNTTCQTPIAEVSEGVGVSVVGAQFVEDPILKGLAVKFRAWLKLTFSKN